jgi:hypothetical protein
VSRSSSALLGATLATLLLVGTSGARVFYSKAEGLDLAFPDADRVDRETFVLGDQEARRIEEIARARLESKILTVYTGRRGDDIVGYAVIDVHDVRTLPEAVLVVLTPEGAIRSLEVLAFYEPEEYLTGERWLEQFEGKTIANALKLRVDVDAIAGATLSSEVVTRAVRRVLALYEVLVRPGLEKKEP